MTHALDDKQIQETKKKAERPIDQDPIFIQVKTMFEEQKTRITDLEAKKVDLENKNKLLEQENGRLSKLVLAKVLTVYKIEEELPVPDYNEYRDS